METIAWEVVRAEPSRCDSVLRLAAGSDEDDAQVDLPCCAFRGEGIGSHRLSTRHYYRETKGGWTLHAEWFQTLAE